MDYTHYRDRVKEAYDGLEKASKEHDTYISDSEYARRHELMRIAQGLTVETSIAVRLSLFKRILKRLKNGIKKK